MLGELVLLRITEPREGEKSPRGGGKRLKPPFWPHG